MICMPENNNLNDDMTAEYKSVVNSLEQQLSEEGLFVRRKCGINATANEVKNAYFRYLMDKVNLNNGLTNPDPFESERTYFMLADKLFNSDFYWCLTMDENRVSDAKALRYWFANIGSAFTDYDALMARPATVLEVLIALADRMDRDVMRGIEYKDRSIKWFWMFIQNLGLDKFTDRNWTVDNAIKASNIIDTWMKREFKPDGKGSPFPLKNPQKDQRTVDLWYQMQAYIGENLR